MTKRLPLLFLALLLCHWPTLSATPITYHVVVDTSMLSGTKGALDFNFNPGPLVSQSASTQILNFVSDGSVFGTASTIGNTSGQLPGVVSLFNSTPYNDYFTSFLYGSALNFDVSLLGPALSAPNGVATSGSTFVFGLFSDDAGTMPVLTSDTVNGFGYKVDVNLDGSTTATSYLTPPAVAPEPNSLFLAVIGVLFFSGIALWKRPMGCI